MATDMSLNAEGSYGISERVNAILDSAVEAFSNDDILGALLLLKQAQAEYKRELFQPQDNAYTFSWADPKAPFEGKP